MKDPKKLTKLKLNKLVHDTLESRHMNMIKGGVGCGCPCAYEGEPTGSSVELNGEANFKYGYNPNYGCNKTCLGYGEITIWVAAVENNELVEY